MESSSEKNTRNSSGVRDVNGVAIRTGTVNEAIGAALRQWSTKFIVARVKTSMRTVENWREGKTGPQAKHVAAMLQDADLSPALLAALGRHDLAAQAEILSLSKRIDALKAAEAQHKEEANGIRRDLEVGRPRGHVGGGSIQQHGDTAAEAGDVVPGQTD